MPVRASTTLQFELLTAMILRGWDRTRVVSCFNHVISFCFCLLSPVKCYTLHIQGPVCNVIGSLEGSAWAGSQAPLPPSQSIDWTPNKTASQLPRAASGLCAKSMMFKSGIIPNRAKISILLFQWLLWIQCQLRFAEKMSTQLSIRRCNISCL